MARLFISYKREEQDYAFALRHWLMVDQQWSSDEIFIDRDKLRAGETWAQRIFVEAERSEVMLFLASHASLQPDSFCYKELQRSRGVTLAVTIKGLDPGDERLQSALPHGADARQITALDAQPTDPFPFVSPIDGSNGAVSLNRAQVESIGQMLRDMGVAPNSFKWTPTVDGPYPGLAALQEGDEAIFFGRDLDIRDSIRQLDDVRKSCNDRVLLIQAPSGAGKSSFLRAGLWRRLRRHSGFTPVAIVRATKGALSNKIWGLAAGMAKPEANILGLTLGEIEERIQSDLVGLLVGFADADRSKQQGRRTLLLGIDQAEEMARLDEKENRELDRLLAVANGTHDNLDVRLVLTVRDDSIDPTLERLHKAGIHQEMVRSFRLHRMPHARFTEIINGPAAAARRVNYPLDLNEELSIALASSASENLGRVGDALPILALALQRLVKKHRAPDGRITLRPEMAEKFISDAVSNAANDALIATNCEPLQLRRLIIPHLVTWDPRAGESGAAKRQVASARALFRDGRADLNELADELVNQRLLTRTSSAEGALYEVSHEALLRADLLGDLIKGLREKFLRADVLKLEIQEWKDSGRKVERLARAGERLREAQRLLDDDDFGGDLSRPDLELADYLSACAAKEREDSEWRELAEKYRAAGLESARRRVEAAGSSQDQDSSEPAKKLNVYISHARRDTEAAQRLAHDLREAGINPLLDVESIMEGENWKNRVQQLVRGADSIIFLVSRSSVSSSICGWEIEEASQLNKRILPVVVERLEDEAWPAAIRNLNAIFMTSEDEWIFGLDSLIAVLSTNLDWLREHTRLGELAARWVERDRSSDLLLRGEELSAALNWRTHRPREAPEPTMTQIAFLNQSQEYQERMRDAERRRLMEMAEVHEERAAALQHAEQAMRRTSRRTRIGLVAALSLSVIASGAGAFAYMQRNNALQQSLLAENSAQEARLALEEAKSAINRAKVAEAEGAELAETQRALLDKATPLPSEGKGDAAFLSEVVALFNDDGQSIRLTRELVFRDSSGILWTVPTGAVVDGASIPRSMWAVVGAPFEGKYRNASILHDYYSQDRSRSQKEVNKMFYEAMLASGVSTQQAQLLYLATERFGPRW